MVIPETMYALAPPARDEKRFCYHDCPVILESISPFSNNIQQLDWFAAQKSLKKLPGNSSQWMLDHVLVTGSEILPDTPPPGRIFVFRRLKERER